MTVGLCRQVASSRVFVLIAATVVSLTCVPARATEITSTIIALYVVDQQVVLADGSIYALPKSIAAARLALGSKVRVTFTSSDGTNMATAVIAEG